MANLADILGHPEWAEDPRFKTFADRHRHRDDIQSLLDEALSTASTATWLETFAGRVPAAPINDIAAAMENPFVAERGGVHDFPHPVEPKAVMRMPAHPIRDGGGPPPKTLRRRLAPTAPIFWSNSAWTRRRLPICGPRNRLEHEFFDKFRPKRVFCYLRQNRPAASAGAAICDEPSMSNILTNLRYAVITGIVLTVIVVVIVTYAHPDATFSLDHEWSAFFIRWLHVLSGVMWIGLLWYLNFVQIPNMPNIPDEQKPAISKVIAPAVLFWFRWAAMATLITGLLLAHLNGYLLEAILLGTDGVAKFTAIGIGMWLGTIMWLNVWFVIWPNQKRALCLVDAVDDVKAASARRAMLFSRVNTVLSIPMLYAMVSAQNLY